MRKAASARVAGQRCGRIRDGKPRDSAPISAGMHGGTATWTKWTVRRIMNSYVPAAKSHLRHMAMRAENIVPMNVILKTGSEVGRMQENKVKDAAKESLVPVCEKYTLTIKEAAAYFNIGIKKMRRMAEENTGRFSVFCGNKYLIIRPKFEKFIDDSSEI